MLNNRILSLLSISMKAGKVKSGEFATDEAVKAGKAFLVIVAADASDNTKKQFRNMCETRKVPYYEYSVKEDLGRALGKEMRSSIAVIDAGLANSLIKQLDNLE